MLALWRVSQDIVEFAAITFEHQSGLGGGHFLCAGGKLEGMNDRKTKLTSAGQILGAVSAVVMFLSAVPVVMWPAGEKLGSRAVSFVIVFLIGPTFFVVGAWVLRLFGVLVFKRHDDTR